MTPFVKLNLPFRRDLATLERCRGAKLTESTGTVHTFKVERAYTVFKPQIFTLLQPDEIHWCDVYTQIAPHIDVVATVRLNVYTITNGATTTFYDEKPTSVPVMAAYKQARESGVPSIYSLKDLEYNSAFVAQQFDVYALNAKVVHAVNLGDGQRSFIQFTWRTRPFADIVQSLKEFVDEPVL